MNWREYPFVRLLAPFVLGVLLSFLATPPFGFLRHDIFLLLPLAGLLFLAWRPQAYGRRWLFGVFAYFFFLVLGYQLAYYYDDWRQKNHFRHRITEEQHLSIGRITALRERGNRWEARLQMEGLVDEGASGQPCGGRLLAYLERKDTVVPEIGDRLLFQSRIRRIEPPDNPAAFDFARYMRVQNIYFQTYLNPAQWRLLPAPRERMSLTNWLASRQSEGVQALGQYLTDEAALGVGSALILGRRDFLDADTKEAYSQTGAMHVLAVSGLHVGLVALFLTFLLKRLKLQGPALGWLALGIKVAGIWGFALLTGASPSVLRAACMFSMLLLGMHLQRYANIYNTLAASAFVLLCIRPFMLLEVGFQLSYLAVLGIVYFQPRLYRLWYVRYKPVQWAWKLTCVSIAAQVATAPISLYYFHQFPVYFWLSGLIVVPAASLILPLGLALTALSRTPLLPDILGQVLSWIINAVNELIHVIQRLPGSLIDGIWINGWTVVLLYAFIFFVVLRLETRRRYWLTFAVGSLLVIGMQHGWRQWTATHQRQVVFYRVYRHTALDLIDGRQSFSMIDGGLTPDQLSRVNQYFHWSRNVRQSHTVSLDQPAVQTGQWMYRRGFMQFYDLRFALLEEPVPLLAQPIEVDYLLIRKSPDLDIGELLRSFEPGMIVFDASNHYRDIDRWKADCRALGQPYHDLNEQGALIVDLNRRS